MDDELTERLKVIESRVLGERIRAARLARGLTQADLGGEDVSVAYVSRIEAGHRRPKPAVLRGLADRLDVPLEQLVGEGARNDPEALRLLLDFSELALESGELDEAEARSRQVLEEAPEHLAALIGRARYLFGRALESKGKVDEAILELEQVQGNGTADLLWVKARLALSRCYRESGDLGRAIDCGEPTLKLLSERGLTASDEAIQLTVTVAAAYFERGDVGEAVRMCRRAIQEAERRGSPVAKASAYWNASMMESLRGSTSAAISLAERALALLGEGADTRNLARLRSQLGIMQLQGSTDIEATEQTLRRAAEELEGSSAGSIDIARNRLALAKVLLRRGDVHQAEEVAEEVRQAVADVAPLVAADARVLQGQAAASRGDLDAAHGAYRSAVLILNGIGADRSTADLWFELGSLWEGVGDTEAARDAYRSAAASTGLRPRSTLSLSLSH